MKNYSKAILGASFAVALSVSSLASAIDSAEIAATEQYDFMLGDWDLDAGTLLPDQTLLPGTGVMNVYYIHEGRTLQADMRVVFEGGNGFIGSTMRTYDIANENWAVSWVAAHTQTNAGGVAVWQEDRMVESWPLREDSFGSYNDTLVLSDITEDRFIVSMDRQYVNGPLIEGVWRYVATRQSEDHGDMSEQ